MRRYASVQSESATIVPARTRALVHDALGSAGRPLDARTRAYMEPRFGRDFSRVRVHDGDLAARSAAAVGAEAFTVGRHIVFDRGRFDPGSRLGDSLLAHELAHTVQQRSGEPGDRPLSLASPHDAAETDATRLAQSAASGRPAAVRPQPIQLARATRTFLLTFDDGPHAAPLGKGKNRTENVLDTLCAKGVQAGFFVQTAAEDASGAPIRGSAPAGKKLIARMAADGHLVGIHTGGKADHEDHTKALKAGRLGSELASAKKAIKGLTGAAPTLVRPPHGRFNAAVSAEYRKLGLTNVLWDIDGDQGKSLPIGDLKKRVSDGISAMIAGGWKGSTPLAPNIVVLYHDIQKNTSANIGTLIDFIKSETSTRTGGKDHAAFPPISCKSSSAPAGAGSKFEGAGDYDAAMGDARLAEADAGESAAQEEEVA